jgi:hypothetical protein
MVADVTEHTHEASEVPEPGLKTQRLAAERGRGQAVLFLALGVGWSIITAVNASQIDRDWMYWFQAIAGVIVAIGCVATGVIRLRARGRRVRDFEAQHGQGAGLQ